MLYNMDEQNNHDKPSVEHYDEVKDTKFLKQNLSTELALIMVIWGSQVKILPNVRII